MRRSLALALFCVLAAGNTFGASLVFEINSITFNDGGSLVGSFVFNPDTTTATSWNLYTTAGSSLGAFAWNATNSAASATSTSITFTATSGSRTLKLVFSSAPTDSGGTFTVTSGASFEESGSTIRSVTTAGSVAAPTPQTITIDSIPASIAGALPYPLAAVKGTGGSLTPVALPLTFSSITPSFCKTVQDQILVTGTGTCTINAGSASQSFSVALAQAAGTLAPSSGSPFATGTTPAGAAVGDFNEDGKPDLAVVNNGTTTVSILLGDGTGNFPTLASSPTTDLSPHSVATGDFDGDGHLDLAVANSKAGDVMILLGNGNGTFHAASGSPIPLSGSPSPWCIAAGDFNGDGVLDLAITSNSSSGGVFILLGNGSGGFTNAPSSPYPTGASPVDIVVADMNNDGISDLVITNETGSVTVLQGTGALNSGSALFANAPGSPYSMGAAITGVAVGDFNRDGLPDFAVTNNGSGSVTVMLQQSGGRYFAAHSPFSAVSSPKYLATGDFNGDGILDLAVPGAPEDLAILLGDGIGNFTPANGSPFSTPSAIVPYFPVVADFNGDGIDDIAVTNAGSANVTVLLGTLAATTSAISTTSPPIVTAGTNVPLTVTVTDDGTAFTAPTGTVTFFDNGTTIGTAAQTSSPWTFTATPSTGGSHNYAASYNGGSGNALSTTVAAVTITVNGSTTLTWTLSGVTFNDGGTLSGTFAFDTNTGLVTNFNLSATAGSALGAFTWTPSDSTSGSSSTGLVFTSNATFPGCCGLNENRVLTLVFDSSLTSAGGAVSLKTNANGSSSRECLGCDPFRTVTAGTVSAPVPQSVAFPAIPNQLLGVSPLAITAEASSGLPVSFSSNTTSVCKVASDVTMLLGTGTCSLTASQGGNSSFQPAAGTNTFTVNQATISGTLEQGPGSPIGSGAFFATATGDFNNDGFADIAAADQGGYLHVFLGSSTGTMTEVGNSPFPAGLTPSSVALGDFNADGFLDIAVGDTSGSRVFIYLGNGKGNFTQPTGSPFSSGSGSGPIAMAVADFNADGKLDIAVADENNNLVTILNGNGTGKFTLGSQISSFGTSPFALTVGDFNEDGKPDVAVVNSASNSNNVTFLFGNGAGGFSSAQTATAGSQPLGVTVGDFNRDGHADIAVANNGSSNVSIFLGSGTGNFSVPAGSPYGVSASPRGLAVADFNGDGIPDLVSASPGAQGVSVLLGDGMGAFSQADSPFGAGLNPVQVSAGDVNGDGREDVAVANFGSDNITVLLGTLAPTTTTLSTTSPLSVTANQAIPLIAALANPESSFQPFSALTNSVSFYDGATLLQTVAQAGSPVSYTISSGFASGTHNITAVYEGASGNATSTSNTLTFTVTGSQAQTITFNQPPNVTFGVAPFFIASYASANSGLTVQFTSNTTPVCTVSGITVTIVAPGPCSITASQAGNATYAAATPVTQTFTVLQTQSITFNTLPNVTFGAAPFTIGASASSGLAVSFTSNTTPMCTVSGTTVTIVMPGTCSIVASQAGNAAYAAATPVTQMFTALLPQTITFNQPPNVALGTAPFSIASYASANSGLTVYFSSSSPSTCTTSGTNGATVTVLNGGPCSITASQAGNATYAAAAPVNQTFQVSSCASPSSSVTVTRSGYSYNPGTQRFSQTVTLTNSGASAVSGPIWLVLDSLSSNATLFNESGVTSCATPPGSPYIQVGSGSLAAGAAEPVVLQFSNPTKGTVTYATQVLAGSGTP